MSERKFHPEIRLFDGSWFGLPAFFVDKLMMPHISKGIPASFWKFTLVLFREMLKPVKQGDGFTHLYKFNTTFEWFEEEHCLGDAIVKQWQDAYAVSGLFAIVKGKRHNHKEPGTPTVWTYNRKATEDDWTAFVLALAKVVKPGETYTPRRGKSEDGVYGAGVFKLVLAIEVDKSRAKINGTSGPGLPPVNTKRIEHYLSQGHGRRTDDGFVTAAGTTVKSG